MKSKKGKYLLPIIEEHVHRYKKTHTTEWSLLQKIYKVVSVNICLRAPIDQIFRVPLSFVEFAFKTNKKNQL